MVQKLLLPPKECVYVWRSVALRTDELISYQVAIGALTISRKVLWQLTGLCSPLCFFSGKSSRDKITEWTSQCHLKFSYRNMEPGKGTVIVKGKTLI